MREIYKKDVVASNKDFASTGTLSTVAAKISELKNQINNFCTTSKEKLQGEGYDAIRNSMGIFETAVNNNKKNLDNYSGSCETANNNMINYLSGVSEITEKFKNEIDTSYAAALSALNGLSEDEDATPYRENIIKIKSLKDKIDKLAPFDSGQYTGLSQKVEKVDIPTPGFHFASLFEGFDISDFNQTAATRFGKIFFTSKEDYDYIMGLPKHNKSILSKAFATYAKGTKYGRDFTVNINGVPKRLDCSSFAIYVYASLYKDFAEAYPLGTDKATNVVALSDGRGVLERVENQDDLKPGDIVLSMNGTGSKKNHALVFLYKRYNADKKQWEYIYMNSSSTRNGGIQIFTQQQLFGRSGYNTIMRYCGNGEPNE